MTSPGSDALLDRLRTATGGEYEIVRELGRGGFAAVYLGRDVELDREVAIKVLTQEARPDDPNATAEIERFRREARTVARLNHPNIVPVYAVKSNEGLQYFVMKFIRGRSLERVLETAGKLPIALVQTILQQAGSALAFAHRNGVVHRDIKPANIMLDEEGWAVVADFGIAKVARAEKLTATGLIIGTAAYMSPEQWAGQDVTGLSDEYSLGVVAYELLTGRSPFAGETIPAMLWAHLNEVPTPMEEVRPDCPPALARIVTRMLEKEPRDRFASLDEMTAALSALPMIQAAEDVRTQLVSLATVTGQSPIVVTADSGERVITGGSVTPSGKVARITVSPAATRLASGASMRLSATPMNDTGKQLARRATAWHSLDARVATVDADGVVMAVGPGTTSVVASCDGVETTVAVTVTGTRMSAPAPPPARGGLRRVVLAAGAVAVVAAGVLYQQGIIGAKRDAVPSTSIVAGTESTTAVDTSSGGAGEVTNDAPTGATNSALGAATSGATSGATDRATGREQKVAPVDPAPGGRSAGGPIGAARVPEPAPDAKLGGGAPAGGLDPNSAATKTAPATDPVRPSVTPDPEATRANVAPPEDAPAANPAVTVSAGGGETCAALSTGDRVLCWGGNAPGGSVLADVYFTTLAVGGGHICGLTPEGAAFCWGDNSQGQLGDGTRAARAAPTAVKSRVGFSDISVGAAHTCALARDGSAWCWGSNKSGQLGDNSIENRPQPVLVRGREAFQSLSAGGSHTCGVRAAKVYCWGDGFSGQIGNAIQDNQREPFPVRTTQSFRSVVTGELHTCGLSPTGRAWCWGDNRTGQLGNETRDNRDVPDSVATDLVFTQLAAGARHTCGITSTRQVACWGENGSGQLGDGTRQRREVPVVIARATQFKRVSSGAAHTCGITRADAVLCWGANSRGQVGTGAAGAITVTPTAIKVGVR